MKTCFVALECSLRTTDAVFHLPDLARLLRNRPQYITGLILFTSLHALGTSVAQHELLITMQQMVRVSHI